MYVYRVKSDTARAVFIVHFFFIRLNIVSLQLIKRNKNVIYFNHASFDL